MSEIERLQARVQELEQERRWIPVSETDLEVDTEYEIVARCYDAEIAGEPHTVVMIGRYQWDSPDGVVAWRESYTMDDLSDWDVLLIREIRIPPESEC